MMPVTLEEPLTKLQAHPALFGIDGGPMTRQEIIVVDPVDETVIATLGKEAALTLAKRLQELAEQIEPGTTGWEFDGADGWRRPLRRLALVDDELRDRDA